MTAGTRSTFSSGLTTLVSVDSSSNKHNFLGEQHSAGYLLATVQYPARETSFRLLTLIPVTWQLKVLNISSIR